MPPDEKPRRASPLPRCAPSAEMRATASQDACAATVGMHAPLSETLDTIEMQAAAVEMHATTLETHAPPSETLDAIEMHAAAFKMCASLAETRADVAAGQDARRCRP